MPPFFFRRHPARTDAHRRPRFGPWTAWGLLLMGGIYLAQGVAEPGPDAPAPLEEEIFPCSECHDGTDVDTTRRVLDEHDDIVLEHDEENRWCLDCHDAVHRDKLRLADGRLLDFTESYRLCGQCHGPKLRDWLAGDHGKRTGSWSGKKEYLLCADCHNPHSPAFKPLEPMPPPHRPEDLR